MEPGTILLRDNSGGWMRFREPREILQTGDVAEIPALLDRIEAATRGGAWAAGHMAYEAAPAFDPAYRVRQGCAGATLIWFGIYEAYDAVERVEDLPLARGDYRLSPWQPDLEPEAFAQCIERIHNYIAAGDTYQVNFTFPLRARFEGDPWALFLDMHRAQRGRHGGYIVTQEETIVSASPELFFAQSGDTVITRPMKGTASRGRWLAEDEARAAALRESAKERAENVMIVDLLRNDLGRIASSGSVEVTTLFDVERYETVLQMTSTIRARTDGHPVRTLEALFPCGSITGAPKVRTMEIIAELETAPRGIYTGAIGWIGPGRQACFSVAIRTVSIERRGGAAVYGVGSGVTWSSTAEDEYRECMVKARLLGESRPDFELLETLLWEAESGYFLLDLHLERLAASARYFGWLMDVGVIRTALIETAAGFTGGPRRVRLLANERGGVRVEDYPLEMGQEDIRVRMALASEPVDSQDRFLFHKTTLRARYECARHDHPEADDVLLWNERGELTESTVANVVVDYGDGRLWTPARECGLLAGTFREWLLREGKIQEGVITKESLGRARRIWLINSLRKWRAAELCREES